jgi:glutathione S-transferase
MPAKVRAKIAPSYITIRSVTPDQPPVFLTQESAAMRIFETGEIVSFVSRLPPTPNLLPSRASARGRRGAGRSRNSQSDSKADRPRAAARIGLSGFDPNWQEAEPKPSRPAVIQVVTK